MSTLFLLASCSKEMIEPTLIAEFEYSDLRRNQAVEVVLPHSNSENLLIKVEGFEPKLFPH